MHIIRLESIDAESAFRFRCCAGMTLKGGGLSWRYLRYRPAYYCKWWRPTFDKQRTDGLQLRCFLDCLILASQDVPRQFSHSFSTEYVFVENCVLIEITYAISTTLPTRSKVTIGQ